MRLTKDDPCACELRALLGQYFLFTRADLRLSQMEFADALSMDKRSYIDIEHRKSLCCSLTLLTYLCYYCKDSAAFLSDCRRILDKYAPPRRKLH